MSNKLVHLSIDTAHLKLITFFFVSGKDNKQFFLLKASKVATDIPLLLNLSTAFQVKCKCKKAARASMDVTKNDNGF